MKRKSFTLVELLVVVAVIAVLASMLMVALSGAQTDARRMRTQGQLEKVNSLVSQSMEEYAFRRFDVSTETGTKLAPESSGLARLQLMRDTLRTAYPDRITDLAVPAATLVALDMNREWVELARPDRGVFDMPPRDPVTVAQARFRHRVVRLMKASEPPQIGRNDGWPAALARWTRDEESMRNESAECLYLILSGLFVGGSPALESFRSSEIADTNGNGLPEIVDSWGNPVVWQRWPVGYWLTYTMRNTSDPSAARAYMLAEARRLGPDGQDYLNSDPRMRSADDPSTGSDDASDPGDDIDPFNCPPLFFSAGPDGVYGMVHSPVVSSTDFPELPAGSGQRRMAYGTMRWPAGGQVTVRMRDGRTRSMPRLFPDPYLSQYVGGMSGGYFSAVGAAAGEGSADNIFSSISGREGS